MEYKRNFNSQRNENFNSFQKRDFHKNEEIIFENEFKEFKLVDEKGNITDSLFDIIAENISKSFVEKDNGKGVSSRQIRKIFDEVKSYDSSITNSSKTWDEVKPLVQMIRSKVAYAVARKKTPKDEITNHAYDNFMSFITCGLKQVDSKEKYHIFVNLFEAVYGFYYQRKPTND